MYSLPQAVILAWQQLKQQLNEHGYQQSPLTPGLWKHKTWPISFTLWVDDFGVKYVGWEHAEHLLQVLKANYKSAIDWEGKKYLWMDFTIDLKDFYLNTPMEHPEYMRMKLKDLRQEFVDIYDLT